MTNVLLTGQWWIKQHCEAVSAARWVLTGGNVALHHVSPAVQRKSANTSMQSELQDTVSHCEQNKMTLMWVSGSIGLQSSRVACNPGSNVKQHKETRVVWSAQLLLKLQLNVLPDSFHWFFWLWTYFKRSGSRPTRDWESCGILKNTRLDHSTANKWKYHETCILFFFLFFWSFIFAVHTWQGNKSSS